MWQFWTKRGDYHSTKSNDAFWLINELKVRKKGHVGNWLTNIIIAEMKRKKFFSDFRFFLCVIFPFSYLSFYLKTNFLLLVLLAL